MDDDDSIFFDTLPCRASRLKPVVNFLKVRTIFGSVPGNTHLSLVVHALIDNNAYPFQKEIIKVERNTHEKFSNNVDSVQSRCSCPDIVDPTLEFVVCALHR